MIWFLMFMSRAESEFPDLKMPHRGIFDWYNALSYWRSVFNGNSLFGFTLNGSNPDFSPIIGDIVNNFHIPTLNITNDIDYVVNRASLLDDPCDKYIGNLKVMCEKWGVELSLESIGVSDEHLNILVSNVFGCFPIILPLFVFTIINIIFYITQFIMCWCVSTPSRQSKPKTTFALIFIACELFCLVSAGFYFAAFNGIDNTVVTFEQLNYVVPWILSSLQESANTFVYLTLPSSMHPLFQTVYSITDETRVFIDNTGWSLIEPPIIANEKMTSTDPENPGVFYIFKNEVQQNADSLYAILGANSKTKNIPYYFMPVDFTPLGTALNVLLTEETKLLEEVLNLDSLFDYIRDVVGYYENYTLNLGSVVVNNRTIGESIDELNQTSITDSNLLTRVYQQASSHHQLWVAVRVIFYTLGSLFVVWVITSAVAFFTNNKFSRCWASSVGICPFIGAMLMFVFTFLFTAAGLALLIFSDNLEPTRAQLLDATLTAAIPSRDIVFPPIDITKVSKGTFSGIMDLEPIEFPKKLDVMQHFVKQNGTDGIASAFNLPEIINIDKFAADLGSFIAKLGKNFSVGNKMRSQFTTVSQKLAAVTDVFPDTIDKYFNWGVPVVKSAATVRSQIEALDPSILPSVETYLQKIEEGANQMNTQYQNATYQIREALPNSLYGLVDRLELYIAAVTEHLGKGIEELLKNVYPIINSLQIEPLLGPYAMVRNTLFYDVLLTCAAISISGHLYMFGGVAVSILLWIRRRDMCSTNVANEYSADSDILDSSSEEKYPSHSTTSHESQNDELKV